VAEADERYLTTREVAAIWRCSPQYVRNLAHRGLLPAICTPGERKVRFLFPESGIRAAMRPVHEARAAALARAHDEVEPPWGKK
jgi:excisionase family DNA binding protein